MTNTDASCHKSYQALTFDDFVKDYQQQLPVAALFELTLPWLMATRDFMLKRDETVVVHCLFSQGGKTAELLIAWPLVHHQQQRKLSLRSLTSFYSAVTEPLYTKNDVANYLPALLQAIDQHYPWHSMHIGAVEETSDFAKCLPDYFRYCKIIQQSVNYYQEGLSSFACYYQQLRSQLRNTVKRRTKKLAATHRYNIRIITTLADFERAFEGYQQIYQQSWKGEEFSFDFIKQVCLSAIVENKLRFGMLTVDDQPAAAQLWFIQSQSASIFKLAYNPQYKNFSVGSILSMALSEHVLEHDKVTCIEFGMGSEPYKKDWLVNKKTRLSYQIFNQRTFSGNLAAFRQMILARGKQFLMRQGN